MTNRYFSWERGSRSGPTETARLAAALAGSPVKRKITLPNRDADEFTQAAKGYSHETAPVMGAYSAKYLGRRWSGPPRIGGPKMILDTTGAYPVVNGHRVRYVTIMRPGWYGCNDSVYDWDGWNKKKDRPVIVELLTAATKCRFVRFGSCGGSFDRRIRGDVEVIRFGYYEKMRPEEMS